MQTFNSLFVKKQYGGSTRFTGVQFHFHSGSEHTIDGKRQDLEMHTVHLPNDPAQGGVKYAAMGLFFSVDDYTQEGVTDAMVATIDKFFDSLAWTQFQANPIVAEVPYGELMMMVDMDNRWTYKGSVTTPPCDTFVYWNVLRRVHPIKRKHLELFKGQLERGGLEMTGNYREVQPLNLHDPYVIATEEKSYIDINLNDKLVIKNQHDGSVSVQYNSTDGSNTAFNPKLDGTFEVTYSDIDKRTFTYNHDGSNF